MLNQTAIRGQRIANAATAIGDKAARELDEVLARPFIAIRNDHQDALRAGLAVSEFAPGSKSADEIRGLWQWVETRLKIRAATSAPQVVSELPASAHIAHPMFRETPADNAADVSWSG